MNWKNMTIGKKIGTGFGIVLFILAIVSVWSILGISNIVSGVGISMRRKSSEQRDSQQGNRSS